MKKAVQKRTLAKTCMLAKPGMLAAAGLAAFLAAAVPLQADVVAEEDAVVPAVVQRVPPDDQLLLLNAVCAMWSVHNNFSPCSGSMDMPLENMVSPETVFAYVIPGPEERLDGVYENSGEVCKVEIAEGVPVIAIKESFYIMASRKNDGHYHIDKLDFSKIEK